MGDTKRSGRVGRPSEGPQPDLQRQRRRGERRRRGRGKERQESEGSPERGKAAAQAVNKASSSSLPPRKAGGSRHFDKSRGAFRDRPHWKPPAASTEQVPELVCALCGQPIKDARDALCDKAGGKEAHFDCALAAVAAREPKGPHDFVAYIGGGRFGVIHNDTPQQVKNFKIRKIIDWENPDERADWRRIIAEHFSNT